MIEDADSGILELTAQIVAAYVEKNPVPVAGLPDLIANVSASISALGMTESEPPRAQPPAVNPKKSVTPDYIICLDDGKKFKSLKRHLMALGTTPEEYRAKWKLPSDYPMVAPNYSAARSALAKDMGLGRKAGKKAPVKKKAATRATASRKA
jgi:predicted transcriptional regulator